MLWVFLANVLDCKIFHHESERDWPRSMQPESSYGVPDNIQMVPNEFAVIGWKFILRVSNRTCLSEFQCIPNHQWLRC
jgi:hypothetical protein